MNKIYFIITLLCVCFPQDCCEALDIATDNCGGLGCYIPQCTENCEWEPMQCWSSTGYCWCVDENGIEIEGTSTPSWQGMPDCEEHTEECFDFIGIDFGMCTMVLGVGLINDECNYISGCSWISDGVDYSSLFFDSIEECEETCDISDPIELGDVNFDGEINVLDIVLLVGFIFQTESPSDSQFFAADYNQDNELNVLDVVSIVAVILNPLNSIQINSGTSYGECWGYCVFELELDNSNALFAASSWNSYDEYSDLILEDNLDQESWQQLVALIDFEYFQSLDDIYGCPDCADGGAEFIEIIYDGVSKEVTFEAYSAIDGIQELTILLRDLREDYWTQINQNQGCYIVPEVGDCDGVCPTYYYNQSTSACEEFITGCCGIEAFSTIEECQSICE